MNGDAAYMGGITGGSIVTAVNLTNDAMSGMSENARRAISQVQEYCAPVRAQYHKMRDYVARKVGNTGNPNKIYPILSKKVLRNAAPRMSRFLMAHPILKKQYNHSGISPYAYEPDNNHVADDDPYYRAVFNGVMVPHEVNKEKATVKIFFDNHETNKDLQINSKEKIDLVRTFGFMDRKFRDGFDMSDAEDIVYF